MKRILAFILTLCLVFSLMPANVVTATGTGNENDDQNQQNNGPVLLSNPATHSHYACTCAIENGNACAGHGSDPAITWTAWTDTSTLPTAAGNYYLTKNIELTNTAAMTIATGTVNLCLNGFSVKFNAANTNAANYHVASGATLNIVNCQAVLDNAGLFVSGNKAALTDLTAGRLYGGKGNNGGALLVEGTANVIGVEFYGNNASASYGGAIQVRNGGALSAVHAKFDSNTAGCGAAIGNNGVASRGATTCDATIILDDTILSNNTGTPGGAVYLKTWPAAASDSAAPTVSPTLTIKGNSRITGNTASGSGGAVYVSAENNNIAPVINLQDDVVITGNKTGNSAKAAVAVDALTSSPAVNVNISGNVQIVGNINTNTGAANVYVVASNANLAVGELGSNARIGVSSMSRLQANGIKEAALTGIFVEKTAEVSYSAANGFTQKADAHKHVSCACILEKSGKTCTHAAADAVAYKPWANAGKLPTSGDWYLTCDVADTATTKTDIAANATLNLCLNGHSIKLNSAKTDVSNYNVAANGKLNIINCQAKLDDNGLYVCGDKNDPTNEVAGRIYNGRYHYGGVIYNKGTVKVVGVEFYDNGRTGGNGGAICNMPGSVTDMAHCLFDDNQNSVGGAFGCYDGDTTFNVHDCVFTNNTGLGGASYLRSHSTAGEVYLNITGNTTITNNKNTSGSGGAIYTSVGATGDTAAQLASWKPVHITMEDDVVITNNTSKSGSKGAVAIDAGNGAANSTLKVSGNVQIVGNIGGNGGADVFLAAKGRVKVGKLSDTADVHIFTADALKGDPDKYLIADGITDDTLDTGITYDNYNLTVGYDVLPDATVKFTYNHAHAACSCGLVGGNACGTTHSADWTPWTSTTTLPTTAGNYYLTGDVTLNNTAAIEIKATINLCLNGFNIKMNSNNKQTSNLVVKTAGNLTIMNCQAKLDDKGLFEAGDIKDTSKVAGRISGGRHTSGGVVRVEDGKLNVYGVEFYDNGQTANGNGGAIQLKNGAELNVAHAMFDNIKGAWGGVISTQSGNTTITLDDTVIQNSTGSGGGAIYLKAWKNTTKAPTLTIKGDSKITNVTTTGSGSAIYGTIAWANNDRATVGANIILQDNVQITGNTSGTKKGAVALDLPSGTEQGVTAPKAELSVSGNVVIDDNTTTHADKNYTNVYLQTTNDQLKVGELGPNANININLDAAAAYSDPDQFLLATADTKEAAQTGITYGTTEEAIGYNATQKFHFAHNHNLCSCVITGETGCTECQSVEWLPWANDNTLPIASGSYYLTKDIVLTNTAKMELSSGTKVNLCLNGFSIKFNENYKSHANYYVQTGAELNIINCQAKLDDKGLLECGNKNAPDNEQAGRLFGGRGLYGGAIYVKGTLGLIGVEFYDNQACNTEGATNMTPSQTMNEGIGGAIRMQDGGKVTAKHSRFENNKALANGGGAIGVVRGNAELYFHDTVFTGNEAIGLYKKTVNGTTTYSTTKEEGFTVDESKGRGGAILINLGSTKTAGQIVTNDVVLSITGDSILEGNYTGEAIGNQGGAIALVTLADVDTTPNNPNGKNLVVTIEDDVQIINNTSRSVGGAIYINHGANKGAAKVTIKDNVKIDGNTARLSGGGAIYLNNSSVSDGQMELTICDKVQITDNECKVNHGGAIYLQNFNKDAKPAIINITDDVIISGNKAAGDGGGVALKIGGELNISGNVRITDNVAGNRGGGLFIHRPREITTDVATPETMKPVVSLSDNVVISGNKTLKGNGGGVYIANDVHSVMFYLQLAGNVKIKNNTTAKNGPNLYLWGNTHVGEPLAQKIMNCGLTDKAEVYTTVNLGPGMMVVDPDEFMVKAENVDLKDTEKTGIIFESTKPPVNVGYNNKEKTLFYFSGEFTEHEDHALCACILTGDDGCKHSGTMEWKQWIYTDKLPTTTGNYYLTGDVVITSNASGTIGVFEVKNGQKVNLCLNGYNIKFSEKNTTKANYYAMVGSELNIINCKAKLDKNNHLQSTDGGKITGGRGMYGGALYAKGKLTLIGIELSDNMVYSTTSQDAMANSYGGAVRIQSGGILRATSCLFQNNKALYHGGAIAVGQGDAEIYLHDTVLKDNEAIGVYTKTEKVDGKTVTTVSPTKVDDSFKLDEAKGRGGAIHFNVAHLTSAGNGITKTPVLELSGNTLFQGNKTNEESGGQGGAIAISNPGPNGFNPQVTIKDNVQILDNCSRAVGGAIYINHSASSGAPQITIQDNVKISGNKSLMGNGGAIYTNITGKSKVPMKLDITDNVQITGNSTDYAGGAIFMQHTTTGEAAEITLSGNAKISDNKAGTTGAGIQLTGQFVLNLTENAEISGNKAVTYAGAIFATKHKNGEKGVEINISGGKITKNEAMGMIDAKTGKLANGYGGGIYIKQGVINFTDGELSQNKANYGGAVFFNTTKFTFTKGTITKNYAKTNGGGISSSQFSEFIMNGSEAVVSYNTTDGPAAGVLIQGRKTSSLDGKEITNDYGTTMTMTKGKIFGNTAKKQGGGVFVSTESRAIIKGGYITGNHSEETGGGMYESKGEILIYGGYFGNNTCMHAGGAVQASEGKLHVYGGTFENNSCKYGGAIRTYNFTDTHIANATFLDNHVVNHGGAIALQSDATVENCTFKGNSALRAEGATNECDGGAIYVWGGSTYDRPSYEVTVKDCLFEENVAEVLGGAMGVPLNCTLNVSNSVFKNNKSNDRGGAIASLNARNQRSKTATLNVTDCEFVENEAVNDGGAIYCSWVTANTLKDSTFTDNVAGRDGGAVFCRKQSDTWIDGCQITGNTAGLRGAAIFAGDNIEMSNITVTGNKSGDAYAVYIDEGGYDGDSYVRAIIKVFGDIIIKDNEGSKPDMFIAKKALVNVGYQGLGDNTNFNVELAEGVLTNTLIGEYNYEGGNLKYTVTAGNRSLTDPEPIPVAEPEVEDTEPTTEPTATEGKDTQKGGFGIGGVIGISAALVAAVIAVLAAVAAKKKKKAGKTAKDTVQE